MNTKVYIIQFLFIFNFLFCNNSLDIISFNIHGFSGKKNANKINEIINKIQVYDLFFIQENWEYDKIYSRKILNHQLLFSKNKRKTIFNSGLTSGVRNDIHIIKKDEVLFDRCNGFIFNGSDCFASKGFTLLRLKYNGQILDLYNTHLDAGDSKKDINTRNEQIQNLIDYLLF